MKQRIGPLLGIVGWLLWSIPGQAQISFEVGSSPDASLVGRMLLDGFQQSDPSLLIVYSSQMNKGDIEFALRTGALDLGLVRLLATDRGEPIGEMKIYSLRGLLRRCVGAGALRSDQSGDLYGVSSASPTPEVRRFLSFVRSTQACQIVRGFLTTPVAVQ